MIKRKNFIFVQLLILALIAGSCASKPEYKIEQSKVELSAGKTVLMEIEMLEWQRAIFPLLDAAIYNNGLNKIVHELDMRQGENISDLQKHMAAYYKTTYNVEIALETYPFFTEQLEYNYFKRKDNEIKRIISTICRNNDAEYFIAFIGQIRTVGVTAFGINGKNRLFFNMVVFNKEGNIISKGEAMSSILKMGSDEIDKLDNLFEEAENSLKMMINEIGFIKTN